MKNLAKNALYTSVGTFGATQLKLVEDKNSLKETMLEKMVRIEILLALIKDQAIKFSDELLGNAIDKFLGNQEKLLSNNDISASDIYEHLEA